MNVALELPFRVRDLCEHDAKLFLAMKLYEVEKVSLGQAARMADCSKDVFMEMLGCYSVHPLFDCTPEELSEEFSFSYQVYQKKT